MELGARMGIGPGGFEPPYPDPKSGVLPLDEGPAMLLAFNLAGQGTPGQGECWTVVGLLGKT